MVSKSMNAPPVLFNYNHILQYFYGFEYLIEEDLVNNVEIQSNNVLSAENDPTFESNLDPRYTFENFIVGESNKFAKATSIAVAELNIQN